VALPLQRYIDVPVFIAANIVVDIEPLLVMIYGFDYPLHGYVHTFIFGGLAGVLFGCAMFPFRKIIGRAMTLAGLPYSTSLVKLAVSGMLGAWIHILFDAPLYSDIRPFYPVPANPFYGIVPAAAVYGICALLLLISLFIYLMMLYLRKETS